MWKYLVSIFFFAIGIIELILAFHPGAREAVLRNSLVRAKRSEPLVLFLAGLSALLMGFGILFYDRFW